MIASSLAKKEKIDVNFNARTPKSIVQHSNGFYQEYEQWSRENDGHHCISDMNDDFIIGYPQLKDLKVISEKFLVVSYHIDNTSEFKNLKKLICDEYPNTICDSHPENAMHVPPMKISLTKDTVHILDWTAPAFMIPKNKCLGKSAKNKLCLVTDLS